MTRLTRFSALAMVLVLCFALVACGSSSGNSTSSAAAKTAEDYANLIKESRAEEDNNYFEIAGANAGEEAKMIFNPNNIDDEMAAQNISMMFETMGVNTANLDSYAFSMSLMMTHAYHIGIYKPARVRLPT